MKLLKVLQSNDVNIWCIIQAAISINKSDILKKPLILL